MLCRKAKFGAAAGFDRACPGIFTDVEKEALFFQGKALFQIFGKVPPHGGIGCGAIEFAGLCRRVFAGKAPMKKKRW